MLKLFQNPMEEFAMPRGDGTGAAGVAVLAPEEVPERVGQDGEERWFQSRRRPGGECMCPKCGTTASHDVGTPCYSMKCPKCGANMVRK